MKSILNYDLLQQVGSIYKKLNGTLFYAVLERGIALIMIGALLLPIIIFQPIAKVSGKTNNPPANTSAPASEPPLPFVISDASENGVIPTAVSRSFSNTFSPVTDFFTTPELPLGFAAAHTESPAYSYLSSSASAVSNGIESLVSNISLTASASNPPSNGTEFDYDGDGRADPAVWHQGSGNWKIKRSSDLEISRFTFGATAAYIVPGDYDGDSVSDLAIFHQGDWAIFQSSTSTVLNIPLGASGDRPVSGDFNGDGMSDAAVFRPSTGGWIIRNSTYGTTTTTAFGLSSDILVPADYDGDGKTDIAVFRAGGWYILGSTAGYYGLTWGLGSDLPVPSDFDGDGKADISVFRPSTGSWYIIKSSSSTNESISQAWGNYNDQPVPADYDGDGKTDFAVFRPKTGMWHIQKSSDWGYQAHTLGVATDKLVEAAYLKQNGSVAFDNAFARTRLSPKNATGGTNLYSQNFGWGSGLVGLPGRSGLSAGFGIGYNSLVWIKHNNAMVFDPDYSNVAPGFRMGFPTIEPIYYDGTTEKYTYMMVSPSGARTEFRQTLVSNIYETADSSYLQITANNAVNPNDPSENVTLTVRGTDGTQMNYEFKGGAYHPTQIKDRNGNYISIVHDNYGNLQTVTDTLGRGVTVNYDGDNFPTSVTQQWNNGNGAGSAFTRTYATFGYATKVVSPGFAGGMTIYGPQGLQVKVLDKIIYGDSSNNTGETRFEYNDFGQVKIIRNYARDGHQLNYTATNLETPGTNLSDVPRLTQTRSWAENFNGVGGIPAETVVNNTNYNGLQTTDLDGATFTGTLIQVQMVNDPHGNITNSFVGASGWMEGLPVRTDDYANNASNTGLELKRTSWTKWTQDDPNYSLIKNPRVAATKIGDDVSTKRTELDYKMQSGNVSDFGLVTEVRLYDAINNTLLNKATTVYNENAAYLSRRIIGLPQQSEAYGVNQTNNVLEKVSKTTYEYDAGNFTDSALQQNIAPIQHDNTNYGASFIVGRANLTSTTRHDVLSQSSAVTSTVKYNTAGAPVASYDALGRQSKIIYEDKFNDNNNSRNTYAYPTKLIDAAGNFSEVKYRFDIGANVWAKSPAPAGNNNGKETTQLYDSLGRLEKETLVNSISGAYTRYEYPTNQIQSKIYTTVIDTNSNGADSADEVYAESWSDGAGRTLRSRTEHPGSTGGWSGSIVEYDNLGRVKRSTVPTEISVSGTTWTPAGDDARYDTNNNLVWLWTSQEYDWKSRVTREINTDLTDRLYSYNGCGCAGGQTTTIQSELVPRDDTSGTARRTQKIYADVLGRSYKTEVMNWDGASVYTATVQTFNGRDQVTKTRQYAGAVGGSTFQDVTMTYDGHGRMKTRHYPIEDAAANTSWTYNADDSIQMIIDPRGAITNFTYETERGLLTDISYQVPANSNIPVTPAVGFEYDALGNRTSMSDGTGTQSYIYDELSRMTSETKTFTALPNNNYTIGYTYHLGGGLKSITDPYNSTVNYTNDKTGRVTAVAGTPWTQNPTGSYADSIEYRAFGQVKQLDYTMPTNTPQIKLDYDTRLRVSHSEVTSAQATGGYVMKADFSYFADSRLQGKNDLLDDKWDRTNKYDFAGRLTFNQFGMGLGSNNSTMKRVYEQTIGYDAFSMMTSRQGVHWAEPIGFTETYSNGRITNKPNMTFDAAGNITNTGDTHSPEDFQNTTFDASGRRTSSFSSSKGRRGNMLNVISEHNLEYEFDGDGRPVIEREGYRNYQMNSPPSVPLATVVKGYQIWSSVLGSSLTDIDVMGGKTTTKVFAGGAVIARQQRYTVNGQTTTSATWTTADPVTGTVINFGAAGSDKEEYEPLGQQLELQDTADDTPEPPDNQPPKQYGALEPEWQCGVGKEFYGGFSGMPFHCQQSTRNDPMPFQKKESPTFIPGYGEDSPIKRKAVPDGLTPVEKPDFKNVIGDIVNPTGIPDEPEEADIVIDISEKGDAPDLPSDLAYYNAENGIGKFINFKNTDYARAALESVVTGDCAKSLQSLFSNLKSLSPNKISNTVRSTNIFEIFDDIVGNQSEGGLFFTEESVGVAKDNELRGSDTIGNFGGITVAAHIGRTANGTRMPSEMGANMFVYVFHRTLRFSYIRSNRRRPAKQINAAINYHRARLVLTLIHELAHAAGKNRPFYHPDLDAAALAVDPSLATNKYDYTEGGDVAKYFDQFLAVHCNLPAIRLNGHVPIE